MSSPEKTTSATPVPIETELFELAALICRLEVHHLKPVTAAFTNTFCWRPPSQDHFITPIGLDHIELTSHPDMNPYFKVVAAEFQILGADEMQLSISKRNNEPLRDDEWSRQLVLEPFRHSYKSHPHTKCLADLRHQAREANRLKQLSADHLPDFKFTDKRHIH